jgi:hypothetical protein
LLAPNLLASYLQIHGVTREAGRFNLKNNTTMKKTLTIYDIAHELLQDENAAWTRAGAFALAEHLQECEEETGEEIEMDIVAIRCDFTESTNLTDWLMEHHGAQTLSFALQYSGIDMDGSEDEEDIDDLIRSYIQDHGILIEFDDGVIVSSF